MFTKKSKLLLIILALNISTLLSDEFSEGPYGMNYFDIAESFSVPDLNISLQGDVNLDETINIQDVILLIGQVLGNTNLNEEQLDQADLNNDNVIDVLDIVNVVNYVLGLVDFTTSQSQLSDMNEDGTVNILDIISIVNIITGS